MICFAQRIRPVRCMGLVLTCAFLLVGCQKPDRDGELKDGGTDIYAFILGEIARHRGKTNLAGTITTIPSFPFQYRRDQDGSQVFGTGDKVLPLRLMLSNAFGEPRLVRTNRGGLVSFNYAVDQIGVAIDCGVELQVQGSATQTLTHLVIVKAGALR